MNASTAPRSRRHIPIVVPILLGALLVACGGGSDSSPPNAGAPVPAGIGAAGGTVTGPGDAQVVIPAGALTQNTNIAITQSSSGAPALPAGVVAVGQMFAFTPHGTAFASAVNVTVPFDPAQLAAGEAPVLFKTTAGQAGWEPVSGANVTGSTITAAVASFSYLVATRLPPLVRGVPERSWEFKDLLADGLGPVDPPDQDGQPNNRTGGIVDDRHDFGPLNLVLNGDSTATGAVFSNEDGSTYWVYAQGPAGSILTPASKIGNRVALVQKQGFKKISADAKLKLHVTRVFVEAIDANGTEILYPECPWSLECELVISGKVTFDVLAYEFDTFFSGRSSVELSGHQGSWTNRNRVVIGSRQPLWGDDFVFQDDVSGNGSKQHARLALRQPIVIDVDISKVREGHSFTLFVEVVAETMNRRQRESYVAAFFRDPLTIEGTTVETTGLEPVPVPYDEPPADAPVAPECTTGTDPDAGTVQFGAASFRAPETAQGSAQVLITRSGGSRGEASARIRSRDDSALAGIDYDAVDTVVYFADGDAAARTLDVPLVLDRLAEPDERLILELSEPRGCVALGSLSDTALTILDDDRPSPQDPTYSVYVMTEGLSGAGLIIEDQITGTTLAPTSSGRQSLSYTFHTGDTYNVRIRTQPSAPDQVCTVNRGSGTIANADPPEVSVICTNVAPAGSLDPNFGTAGKVSVGDLGEGKAVVVQSDGHIVALTSRAGIFTLARFNADGSTDASFGTAGRVEVHFTSGTGEEAYGLSVQPDDKLLVVGRARVGTRYDMGVARYNANGTVDLGFGGHGVTTINPFANLDPQEASAGSHRANKALVLADGTIYIAGAAMWFEEPSHISHLLFAAAKLDATGAVSPDFGARANSLNLGVGFTRDAIAYGLALQSDGKLVLAGSALFSSLAGMARYKPNGSLDTDDPPVVGNFGPGGLGSLVFDPGRTSSGVARDLVVLDDNSSVVATNISVPNAPPLLGGVSQIRLWHIDADGSTPRTSDYTDTPLGPQNDIAYQLIRLADGKFLLAASASSSTTGSDFGIIRYNSDRSLDSTFGVNGAVLVDFFGASDSATGIAIAPDGGIIAVGSARNGTSFAFGMLRIAP